jgi:ABC-2 type transport system permease protein
VSAIVALVRRDLLIWASYRMTVVAQAMSIVVVLTVVYFIGHGMSSNPARYGGQATDYFSFVLAGLTFGDILLQSFLGLQESLRDAQLSGTLEPLLLTRIRISSLVVGSSLFRIGMALLRGLVYVGLSVFVFGYWHQANPSAALLVLIAGGLACALYGVLAAAFVLTVKRGEAAVTAFIGANGILGGALFPTSLLPAWVQPLVAALPFTHALAGIRLALQGAGFDAVGPHLIVLTATCVALAPLAAIAFNLSLRRARQEGSLVHY